MKTDIKCKVLDELRYSIKVHTLCKKMTECMKEEDVISCAETTAKALEIIPNHKKEELIDKLIGVIDGMRGKDGDQIRKQRKKDRNDPRKSYCCRIRSRSSGD